MWPQKTREVAVPYQINHFQSVRLPITLYISSQNPDEFAYSSCKWKWKFFEIQNGRPLLFDDEYLCVAILAGCVVVIEKSRKFSITPFFGPSSVSLPLSVKCSSDGLNFTMRFSIAAYNLMPRSMTVLRTPRIFIQLD